MKVFIHSLEKTLYEGDASVTVLPAESGEISVLEGHVPLSTALSKGVIRVKGSDASQHDFQIVSGFAQVNGNHLIILTN